METEQMPALRWAFQENHFILRFHGLVEMNLEGISVRDLSNAGRQSELLEEYQDRPEGYTKLLLGVIEDQPIHIVINVQEFHDDPSYPLAVSPSTDRSRLLGVMSGLEVDHGKTSFRPS